MHTLQSQFTGTISDGYVFTGKTEVTSFVAFHSACPQPRVFTKIIGLIVPWLWQLGVRLIAYIDGFLLGGSPHTNSTHDHGTASIGFLDQQQEIHPNTLPGNRILRSNSLVLPPVLHLCQHKLQILKSKAQQLIHKDASHQTITARDSSQIYWDSQCCNSGDTTRSTILQVPPDIQTPFAETGGAEQSCTPDRQQLEGA